MYMYKEKPLKLKTVGETPQTERGTLTRSGRSCGMPDAQELAGRVRVAVRLRPRIARERDDSATKLAVRSATEVSLRGGEQPSATSFAFDAVFGPDADQQAVFDGARVGDMVAAVLDGYNATVLAYGQTGSGKTHTMEGFAYGDAPAGAGAAERLLDARARPRPDVSGGGPSPATSASATAHLALKYRLSPCRRMTLSATRSSEVTGSVNLK